MTSPSPLWDEKSLRACINPNIPPGVIVVDGFPYPLIEFPDYEVES